MSMLKNKTKQKKWVKSHKTLMAAEQDRMNLLQQQTFWQIIYSQEGSLKHVDIFLKN